MKNTQKAFVLVLAASFLPNFAIAKKQSFNVRNLNLTFDVPKGWTAHERMWGAPLAFVGPGEDGHRPVIALSITKVPKKKKLKKAFFKATEGQYKKERKKWVNSRFGEVVSFDKYKKTKFKRVKHVHQRGVRYKMATGTFHEKTFTFACRNNWIIAKTLVSSKNERQMQAVMEDTLKHLKCS